MILLLASALRATVILGAAWVAARLLHSASADVRHRLWRAAICTVASLPGLLWLIPPVLPADVPLALSAHVSASEASSSALALPTLSAIWTTGVLLVLGRLTIGLVKVARISRASQIVDGVQYSTLVESPITWGWWRPVIVLPMYAADWSIEQRRLLLCHEQAHVERRDWIWQMLAQVVSAIFWFHPLIWVANSALRRESEAAADDRVLAQGVDASGYATQLLSVARHMSRASPVAAVSMIVRPALEARLRAILDSTRTRRRAGPALTFTMVGIFSMLCVPLAALQGGRIYRVGDEGLTPPRVIHSVKPYYTQEAIARMIQGIVMLQAEVTEKGLPANVRVTQKLDEGLDASAVNAARQWRFDPGTKDGQPVRVEVVIETRFTLK